MIAIKNIPKAMKITAAIVFIRENFSIPFALSVRSNIPKKIRNALARKKAT